MTTHRKKGKGISTISSGKEKRKVGEVFQLKITLRDSSPKVWRRILVPSEYTFFALHCAIQDAVGWTDSHLHAFILGRERDESRIMIQSPNPDGDIFEQGETRDERTERIADYFGKTARQCVYWYDFGDDWTHTILFERILPREPKSIYPQCITGKNACPPDDCGGIWGYANLQEIIKNPRHKEHADMLEWLDLEDPKDFHPEEFDPSSVRFTDPKKRLAAWNKGFGYH